METEKPKKPFRPDRRPIGWRKQLEELEAKEKEAKPCE